MNRTSNLPYYTALAGMAVIVIVVGFIGGVLLFGAFGGNDAKASGVGVEGNPVAGEETPGPSETTTVPPTSEAGAATSTVTPPDPTAVPPTATKVPPTATLVPPTPTNTPVPPTSTPVPTIEYLDIFRAEGGETYKNANTTVPLRRVEAVYDNSYIDCPSGDCVRGRVQAAALAGPFTIAERLEASALVYNTFRAWTTDAELQMDVSWSGSLVAVTGADAHTSVALTVTVMELDEKGKVVRTVAGLPYTIMEEEIGAGIQGFDSVTLKDSRSLSIPMRLVVGKTYRVELELTCDARAAFSASVTGCSFWGEDSYAEWTAMRVAFYP
jgi:hypothetical protein